VIGHDDNWTLTPTEVESDFYGFNVVAQYAIGKFMPGAMIDWIEVDKPMSFETREVRLVTPFIRYFLRDNFQIDLYGQIDDQGKNSNHPDKDHAVLLNFRTMF